jgi:hypothetical protein
MSMSINEIRVVAKLFYGEADAYDTNIGSR